MDKSGDSKWGELINRHEISSACPRVDAETIAKTGETLSNSQSTGGGARLKSTWRQSEMFSLKQAIQKLWSFNSLPLGE